MRYTETREQSAELLRAVVARMGGHEAAFNPLCYAVWYEALAGTNTPLKQALEACLKVTPRLDDTAIARLHARYISPVDEPALRRASGDLQDLMSGMAASAESTGKQAGAFGEQLSGLTDALRGNDGGRLGPLLDEAIAGATGMKHTVQALSEQVEASRREIERLHGDLTRARDEALIDPLTQVLNRKGLDLELQRMLQSPPAPGGSLGLVMIDIDHFKGVNDTHGHVMGDRVLQVVAQALRTGAPASMRLARYGGEEFAALCSHCSPEAALAEAEAMRLRVKAIRVRDRRTKDVVLTVTVSAGVAIAQPGEEAAALVARADQAMYAAKRGGRDRVCAA
jgi:diguanylate cyclase